MKYPHPSSFSAHRFISCIEIYTHYRSNPPRWASSSLLRKRPESMAWCVRDIPIFQENAHVDCDYYFGSYLPLEGTWTINCAAKPYAALIMLILVAENWTTSTERFLLTQSSISFKMEIFRLWHGTKRARWNVWSRRFSINVAWNIYLSHMCKHRRLITTRLDADLLGSLYRWSDKMGNVIMNSLP